MKEAREAAAAAKAARAIAEHPGQPLPAGLAQIDALATLRAEQEQIIREIEASERATAQSVKGQHMS